MLTINGELNQMAYHVTWNTCVTHTSIKYCKFPCWMTVWMVAGETLKVFQLITILISTCMCALNNPVTYADV